MTKDLPNVKQAHALQTLMHKRSRVCNQQVSMCTDISAWVPCLQVRYERRAGAHTIVKVMTDGILLRELQARPKALR